MGAFSFKFKKADPNLIMYYGAFSFKLKKGRPKPNYVLWEFLVPNLKKVGPNLIMYYGSFFNVEL